MSHTVSVIIPTYNRVALLRRALDSVFQQTRPADEVIVVDDGSTDATPQLVQDGFPQVHYLRQANAGVSAARNRGIRQAKGDWLAFLDSDDAWLPDKLERQLQDLRQGLDVFISHTDELWMRRGNRVNPMKKHAKTGGWIYHRCLPLCVISPSAAIIRRQVFERVGSFDETLPACEDYDLWLRICALYPVRYLAEPLLVKYGGHPDQLSRRYWGMDRFRIKALEKMVGGDTLGGEDRLATLRMLIEKLDIYSNGAHKRGKREEAAWYGEKKTRYAECLAELR